uniref:AAA+ ATPase domain-containing protein n=1 Tax=Pyrodinium bahamense TaxID=73915 RepID=A0A7S0A6Y5_9DINO
MPVLGNCLSGQGQPAIPPLALATSALSGVRPAPATSCTQALAAGMCLLVGTLGARHRQRRRHNKVASAIQCEARGKRCLPAEVQAGDAVVVTAERGTFQQGDIGTVAVVGRVSCKVHFPNKKGLMVILKSKLAKLPQAIEEPDAFKQAHAFLKGSVEEEGEAEEHEEQEEEEEQEEKEQDEEDEQREEEDFRNCLRTLASADELHCEDGQGNTLLDLALTRQPDKKSYMRMLVSAGFRVNHKNSRGQCPLYLACTAHGLRPGQRDEIVRFLLSLGACPSSRAPWGEYITNMSCLSFTSKYWLALANSPPVRKWFRSGGVLEKLRGIGSKAGLVTLFRIRELLLTLVGQRLAATSLVDTVACWAFDLNTSPKPLFLLLAGPSGHGKTELAKALDDTLAAGDDFIKIDCAQNKDATEVFGLSGAYQGAQQGSELNNWLARHDNKVGVVLLDEFEKTGKDVWEQLLNVVDKGEYTDKRLEETGNQTRIINTTKVLFIATTNALDPAIERLVNSEHMAGDKKGLDEIQRTLERDLRPEAANKFTPAVAGRMDAIIPFLPFEEDVGKDVLNREVCVLIDMNIQRLIDRHSDKQKNGHCSIDIFIEPSDREEIRNMALEFRQPAEGARSIARNLRRWVSDPVKSKWIQGDVECGGEVKLSVRPDMRSIDVEIKSVGAVG